MTCVKAYKLVSLCIVNPHGRLLILAPKENADLDSGLEPILKGSIPTLMSAYDIHESRACIYKVANSQKYLTFAFPIKDEYFNYLCKRSNIIDVERATNAAYDFAIVLEDLNHLSCSMRPTFCKQRYVKRDIIHRLQMSRYWRHMDLTLKTIRYNYSSQFPAQVDQQRLCSHVHSQAYSLWLMSKGGHSQKNLSLYCFLIELLCIDRSLRIKFILYVFRGIQLTKLTPSLQRSCFRFRCSHSRIFNWGTNILIFFLITVPTYMNHNIDGISALEFRGVSRISSIPSCFSFSLDKSALLTGSFSLSLSSASGIIRGGRVMNPVVVGSKPRSSLSFSNEMGRYAYATHCKSFTTAV
ncbi:hypothetical protein BCR41DRAFT_373464, partial [Lobosporangium transversale]